MCAVATALWCGFAAPAHAVQSCSFGAGTLALGFGQLDPSASGPPTVVASTSGTWGGCSANMSMSVTSWTTGQSNSWALAGPGGNQIPYVVSVPAGKATAGGYVGFTLSAQIAGSAYVDAVPGSYADVLQIMVTP